MFRLAEVSLGLVASVVAVFGLGVSFFGTVLNRQGMYSILNMVVPGSEQWVPSFARSGLSGVTIIYLVVMFLAAVGIGTGAYLHAQRSIRAGLTLLWGCTVVYSVGVVISDLSIVLFVYEALPLALVVCIMGTVREIQGPGRESD